MTGSSLGPRAEVLSQEAFPEAPWRPLRGLDARPCFLRGEVGALLPRRPGKAQRHHEADEKPGSGGVLRALEPPTGLRDVDVRQPRTAVD
jgi:hypothetical protein